MATLYSGCCVCITDGEGESFLGVSDADESKLEPRLVAPSLVLLPSEAWTLSGWGSDPW